MGESKRKALAVRQGVGSEPTEPQVVDTLGGRMHVRWGQGAAATPWLRRRWRIPYRTLPQAGRPISEMIAGLFSCKPCLP